MFKIMRISAALGISMLCAFAAAGNAASASKKGTALTRTAKIEKRIDQWKKWENKHSSALRFHKSKKFRWMIHPNQMDKPCWQAKLRGPLKVCMAARAQVRLRTRELRRVRTMIRRLESLLLDVGNVNHWMCIHRGERNPTQGWATNTGNGYYGGLQMDWSFMSTYGPPVLGFPDAATMFREKGTADRWSAREQMAVAEYARKSGRGYYPWPNTARHCGLI